MVITSQILNTASSSSFFWHYFVSLVKFSYRFKFHVSIITGSGVMAIYVYKGLIKNLEIRNAPVWVLPNIWRPERVRNVKFGTNVSNKMLLNTAKCLGYSFYRFWVIGGSKFIPPLRLGLKCILTFELKRFFSLA